MEDDVKLFVRFNSQYGYMRNLRPGAKVDVNTGELQDAEPLGEGPFEARVTSFTHDPELPALSIKLPGGGWSNPMNRMIFEECED